MSDQTFSPKVSTAQELKVLRAEVEAHRSGKFDDSWALQCEDNWRLEKERDALCAALEQEKKWKVEDPRMLREQIRVADLAFNHLHVEHAALKLKLEAAKVAIAQALSDVTAGDWMKVKHRFSESTVTKMEEALTQLNSPEACPRPSARLECTGNLERARECANLFMNLEAAAEEARKISATLEPSAPWQPVARIDTSYPEPGVEIWENEIYSVTVRRNPSGWPFGAGGRWALLGIHAHDGSARHDWREFQRVKNDICGEQWEAIELYPAESRLLDPSNYYMLWCAPQIRIGKFGKRVINTTQDCIAPQRGWHADAPGSLG